MKRVQRYAVKGLSLLFVIMLMGASGIGNGSEGKAPLSPIDDDSLIAPEQDVEFGE